MLDLLKNIDSTSLFIILGCLILSLELLAFYTNYNLKIIIEVIKKSERPVWLIHLPTILVVVAVSIAISYIYNA